MDVDTVDRQAPTAAGSRRPQRSGGPRWRSFVILTFGLSVPFWVVGAATGGMIGGLPVSAAMLVCPAIAASILVFRRDGRGGLVALWRRTLDRAGLARRKIVATATAVVAAAVALTAITQQITGRPPTDAAAPWQFVPVSFGIFVAGAVLEEIGWSSGATDDMLRRRTPAVTGLGLGLIWAVWHYIPLLQAGRSVGWILWWTLFTIALRVILVVLYDRAGRSLPVTVIGHAASNVATVSFGDFFDPAITGIVLALEAIAIVLLDRRDRPSAWRTTRPNG